MSGKNVNIFFRNGMLVKTNTKSKAYVAMLDKIDKVGYTGNVFLPVNDEESVIAINLSEVIFVCLESDEVVIKK